ncbi:MAG: IclR family transcriptional regulator [Pseudomonadota bacterium]
MDARRFARSFDLLDLLVEHPGGLRLSEIATLLEAPVSSVHDLLKAMASAGVVSLANGRNYTIGPRAIRLGFKVANAYDIKTLAQPHMKTLASSIGDDVYLALRIGNDVACAARVAGNQPVSVNIRVGHIWPLHSTSAGKLFAAHDEQLRHLCLSNARRKYTPRTMVEADELEREFAKVAKSGFAISREEMLANITGYATPVRDTSGHVIAAIHVAVLSGRAKGTHERKIRQESGVCAAAIEADLAAA